MEQVVKELQDNGSIIRYFSPGPNPSRRDIARMEALINDYPADRYEITHNEQLELPSPLLEYLWELSEYHQEDPAHKKDEMIQLWNQIYQATGQRPEWEIPAEMAEPVPSAAVADSINQSPFDMDDLLPYIYADVDMDEGGAGNAGPALDLHKVIYTPIQ